MNNLMLILLSFPYYWSSDKHFINDLKLTVTLPRIPSLYIYISHVQIYITHLCSKPSFSKYVE